MENYMFYNPMYPTTFPGAPYTVPAEHNVYISNYFLGNTTLESGGYSTYPRPPPPYSESEHHTTYSSPEDKPHPPLYDKFGPYPSPDDLQHEQFEPCTNPEKSTEPQTPDLSDSSSYRDTVFGSEAQFDVWKNVKDEQNESEGQPSCVYSNNPVKEEMTSRSQTRSQYGERKENQMPAYNPPSQFTPQSYGYNHSEATLVEQIQEAHLQGDHKKVMELIATNYFTPTHHDTLQELWLSAVYGFAKLRRGKPPNAVDRYRLRKKYPFPATVWDGERTLYCYKQSARDQLEDFYQRNKYPTPLEKRELSEKCDLSYMQVCNWFKNKRMRGKEQVGRQQRNS